KPSTSLFATGKGRSGAWRLSTDFIESVSQILEHKAAGLIKMDKPQFIGEELIKQKAYDSKVLLIIGHWNELDGISTKEREIKKKTFELFRRNNRNIEMLTFDELYERAKFIVGESSEDNNDLNPFEGFILEENEGED